jgi:hypothetical protein
MADLKTTPTSRSVAAFLNEIDNPATRADCKVIAGIMRAATGNKARMWGATIVGFGHYDYRYTSGHEGFTFCADLRRGNLR